MTIPAHVFCDTSFFYACLDPQDRNHPRAVLLVTESAASGTVLHTTWDVISETATLLRYRRHFHAARAFLLEVKPTLRIMSYGDGVREEAQHRSVRRIIPFPLSRASSPSVVCRMPNTAGCRPSVAS